MLVDEIIIIFNEKIPKNIRINNKKYAIEYIKKIISKN